MPSQGRPIGQFDCTQCRESLPEAERANMHCGYLDERLWTVGPPRLGQEMGEAPSIGGQPYDVDVCPGWLVREHEGVLDGAQAYAAQQAGIFALYHPRPDGALLEAVMTATQAFNLFAAEEARRAAKQPPPR